MITLERTLDYELVRQIMTHPALYLHLVDDAGPSAENFWPAENRAVYHLVARDGDELLGLFITHPINSVLWEAHHALLPNCRGGRALAAGRVFLAWLWENTRAQSVLGLTPSYNGLALRFARVLGLVERGRLPGAYRHFGELYDLVIFSKQRS